MDCHQHSLLFTDVFYFVKGDHIENDDGVADDDDTDEFHYEMDVDEQKYGIDSVLSTFETDSKIFSCKWLRSKTARNS